MSSKQMSTLDPRAAHLLLELCELSADVFDRLIPTLDDPAMSTSLRILTTAIRKGISIVRSETSRIGEEE